MTKPSEHHRFIERASQDARQCYAPEQARPAEGACCAPDAASPLGDEAAKTAADLFKALADPARLQILAILSQRAGEVCVCNLEGQVGLPDEQTGQRPKQPTVSHHLKVLRDAGLVGYEKRGVWAYYFLRRERLANMQALLSALTATPDGVTSQLEQPVQSLSAIAVRGQR